MALPKTIATFIGLSLLCISLQAQPLIKRVEYFIDTDPGMGSGVPISFVENSSVSIDTQLDLSAVSDGLHWIYFRSKDADNKWSHTHGRIFFMGTLSSASATHNISGAEYFFDSDPGYGKGYQISVTPSPDVVVNEVLTTGAITDGFHWIYIRAKNDNGNWSHSYNRLFYKGTLSPAPSQYNLSRIEYFFDTDPGFGKGIPLSFTTGPEIILNQTIDVSSLSDGLHWIYIRGRDSNGKWGHFSNRFFYKGALSSSAALPNIVKAEYYFDTDPGFGKGTPFTINPGNDINIGELIDVSSLSDGFHWFYTRSLDASGKWSHSTGRFFYKGNYQAAQPVPNLKRVEYFFDTDPGIGKGTTLDFTPSPIVNIEENLPISSLSIGKHTFAVRIQDSYGKWSYLSTRSFTTDITPPAAPQSPSASAGDSRVTLKWRKNTESDFLKYLIYTGNVSGGEVLADSTSAGVSDTSRVLTELTNNVNYYFYITALDSARQQSPPSTEVGATPVAPVGVPAAPVARAAAGILQNSFIANWSLCTTATGYRIDVATNSTFSSILASYNNKDIGNVTSYNVTGLNVNTTYYYRIRSYNADGTNPVASNTITVKTLLNPPPPPAPPVAVAATVENQTSFVANWRHAESASGYKLDVSDDIDFGTYLEGYEKKDVLFATTYPVTGLSQDKRYYYRVYGYNLYGTGNFSNAVSAKTLSTPLNLPNPPSAIAATNPTKASFTANWGSSPGATGYYIDVATNSAFTPLLVGYNKHDAGLATSIPITGLNPNTNYYYRVYAYNADGPSTPSGTILVKTLLNIPNAPTGLTVSSCDDLVTLKWRKNSETDISRYKIYGGTTINPVVEIATTTGGASDTSKIISGLTRGQVYYFRIAAENLEDNTSEYSNTSSVSVYKGVVPAVKVKWGDVLICSNVGDSIDSYQWYRNGNLIPGSTGQYFVSNKSPGNYAVQTIDERGCVNMSASKSIGGAKSINFYPNPANSLLSVETENLEEGKALIRLYNALGIRVLEKQIVLSTDKEVNDISVSNLQPGVYYIEIIIRDERASYSKIVVTK